MFTVNSANDLHKSLSAFKGFFVGSFTPPQGEKVVIGRLLHSERISVERQIAVEKFKITRKKRDSLSLILMNTLY